MFLTSGRRAGIDEPVRAGCRKVLNRIVERKARVAEPTRKFEVAMRAGKRRVDPLRREQPKPAPTPGHESGDAPGTRASIAPPPGSVTECHQAPFPHACAQDVRAGLDR